MPSSPLGQTNGSSPTGSNGPSGESASERPMHWRGDVASRAV
ncbi:Uncharacterised protein [Mycobacteroides abscessus]|nr:Uncharacterised protein [Mycobacteroides abscessus]